MSSFGQISEKKPYGFYKNEGEPLPLVDFLRGRVPGDVDAAWLIAFGAVYLGQLREIDPQAIVATGDLVRVHFQPKRYQVDRDDLRRRIISETPDYLIVDKPSGLPMHPTLDNLYENLISGFDGPLHVTHRLDVPTSGVVVVAKTKEYQSLFNRLVAARQIQKIYEARVERPVSVGLVTHYMKVMTKAPKEVVLIPKENDGEKWELCQLEILSCEKMKKNFKVRIKLLTGRTHQIRAQLSALGSPILGDEMYSGAPRSFFGLHAAELSFMCPRHHIKVLAQSSFICSED